MLKVFDAYILDWPELAKYVEIAAELGANAPNDVYLAEHKGPFLVVPVMNTTDTERLMAVIEIPQTPNLIETMPELPEVLTISNMSVIDGSMGNRSESLLVLLEVPTKAVKDFTIFPRRLPQEFVKNCRALGLQFLSRQMRQYGENEAADRMMAEAEKLL